MARDPLTGLPLITTKDELDKRAPFKGFPDKEYLRNLIDCYYTERDVMVEKSRQMIISTATCLYILWETLFLQGRRWLISKTKEQDGIELIRDKIRGPWARAPEWFKAKHPITPGPQRQVYAKKSDSYITAVTENVANRTARGGTASGFFLDEAAFQQYTRDIYAAARPMADKIIMVSTPSMGPGGIFMRGMLEQSTGGTLMERYMVRVREEQIDASKPAKKKKPAKRKRKAPTRRVSKAKRNPAPQDDSPF
jgi:hypothetical protein